MNTFASLFVESKNDKMMEKVDNMLRTAFGPKADISAFKNWSKGDGISMYSDDIEKLSKKLKLRIKFGQNLPDGLWLIWERARWEFALINGKFDEDGRDIQTNSFEDFRKWEEAYRDEIYDGDEDDEDAFEDAWYKETQAAEDFLSNIAKELNKYLKKQK